MPEHDRSDALVGDLHFVARPGNEPGQLVCAEHVARPVPVDGDDMADRQATLSCACGFAAALGHDDVIRASIAVCPACGDVSTRQHTAELELLEVR
jgi:hypothetical protein